MADDLFAISKDSAHCLLRIRMLGLWMIDTVEDYRRAVVRAAAGMAAAGYAQDDIPVLVDARHGNVMQQDGLPAYRDRTNADNLVPKRLATSVSSALLERQVERIAAPNRRLFAAEGEVSAWLFDGSVA